MILITAPVHPWLTGYFSKKGYAFRYEPAISPAEVDMLLPELTGLVVTTRVPVTAEMMNRAPYLKWIGRLGSGMELIDVDYARKKNIQCVSTPEGNRNAVAEHTLALLLNLMNNINRSNWEIHQLQWRREENRGFELSGKTVGIIGYGNTGEAFAKILTGFQTTVLAYDRYRFGFGKGNVREAGLEQVCRYADVISFHVPLTDETFHLADEAFFDSLQNKPFIINTSRGPVTNTRALLNAIRTGKIAGAALDVLEKEPLSGYDATETELLKELMACDNVLITPHIAGYSHEAFLKMAQWLVKKLKL